MVFDRLVVNGITHPEVKDFLGIYVNFPKILTVL